MIVMSVCRYTNSACIMSGERQYSCPIAEIDGMLKFKFKNEWHTVAEYATPNTLYNNDQY